MSRETDNSSSGPQGHGNAPYPSVPSQPPPYGTGGDGRGDRRQPGPDAERAPREQRPERRTETTLTTRVRINIPGSRPIPPVVMRTPMSDVNAPEAGGDDTSGAGRVRPDAPGSTDPAGIPGAGAGPAGRGAGPAGGGRAAGSAGGGRNTGAGRGGGSGRGAGGGAAEAAAQEGSGSLPTSSWFAPPPRKSGGGRTSEEPDAAPAGNTSFGAGVDAIRPPGTSGPPTSTTDGATAAGLPRRRTEHHGQAPSGAGRGPADPLGATAPGHGHPADAVAPGGAPPDGRSGLYDLFDGPDAIGAGPPGGPGDPGGPGGRGAAGPGGRPGAPGGAAGPGSGAGPGGSGRHGRPGGPAGAGPRGDETFAFFPQAPGPGEGPAGPTGGPATGGSSLPPGVPAPGGPIAPDDPDLGSLPPRMSDDTAILTPQKPAPGQGAPDEHVSGHTVTSGVPVSSAGRGAPRTQAPDDTPHEGTAVPAPPPPKSPERSRAAGSAASRRRGRNKLVLLAVAAVVLLAGIYCAGLLMNHSDVPKGTTVLGVDIGGGTHDEAVKKLDAALGKSAARTLQLSVDGKNVPLRPDQAGLSLDTDATVQDATRKDYNPITVIGALFGGERAVQPVMPVDKEKLHAALERAGGGAGSMQEGGIKFEPGRVSPVYGHAGKGIDPERSATAVEQAYRVQVEKGTVDPVVVTLTTRESTVSRAEVDRMMRDFAKPAMSGIVTVEAGGKSIRFGPEKSLPQILGVRAVGGKLVDTYDKAAVKRLYGHTFDGVLITRATGKKTPVQPEDVIGVMREALKGRTPAQRTGVIATDPS